MQRDGGMSRSYDGNNLLNVALRVDVECYAKAATDEALGAALSDLYAKVTAKVLEDPTLGNLAIEVTEADDMMGDPIIAKDKTNIPHAAFVLSFLVRFYLRPGNPYSAAP